MLQQAFIGQILDVLENDRGLYWIARNLLVQHSGELRQRHLVQCLPTLSQRNQNRGARRFFGNVTCGFHPGTHAPRHLALLTPHINVPILPAPGPIRPPAG